MTVISLDKYSEFFKDEVAFKQFVELLRKEAASSGKNHATALVSGEECVGGVVSSERVREMMYNQLLHKIAEKPGILDELLSRLNDDIVGDE